MKIVRLRGKSDEIQITVEEALKEALKTEFDAEEVIIILHSDKGEGCGYEFWQGGGVSNERMLWHLEKYKKYLMNNEIRQL